MRLSIAEKPILKIGQLTMYFERLVHSMPGLSVILIIFCFTAMVAGAAPAATAIKIDTTADKYALQDFSFEVSPETGNAAVRLEYAYPGSWLQGDDSDRGPTPRIAMLTGLIYDAAAHAIVFNNGSTRITCATEVDHMVLLWKTMRMKPTGACTVSAHVTHHSLSDGWGTTRFNTLDAYFEVRRK
jgi:hypothetical protein